MFLTSSLRKHHGAHFTTFKLQKADEEVDQGSCVARGTLECFGDVSRSLVQQTCWLCLTALLLDDWVWGRYKSVLQALVPKAQVFGKLQIQARHRAG